MVHIGAQEEKNRLVAFLSRGEKKKLWRHIKAMIGNIYIYIYICFYSFYDMFFNVFCVY
jgi:hypothetical protein